MKDKPVILVVDDLPENIELLEAHLVLQGYDVVAAATGGEALFKLSDQPVDLVLMDVMMPGMDGFEVTRRIRQDPVRRLIPIILVTALRDTEDRISGIEAGCDDFVSKPFDKVELLARVRALLKVKAYNDLLSNYRKELETEVARRTEDLADLNAGLEKMVADRTADLNQALSELETEKYELGKRNAIMENDLDMARKIQKRFIPSESPAPYISFRYKPAEKVGGDFLDFIRFADDDRIGIFISDVSGHGVPAAFITAMIKSSILQTAPSVRSPARVLEILNDRLIDQSAGYFITSFYGVYNPATRKLVYSSAGHNSPYVINGTRMESLNIRNKAVPLAVQNNGTLRDMNVDFTDETVILEKGSKLILYTDGLTEAVNIKRPEGCRGNDFENEMLARSFRTHFNKPSKLFLEGVYRDLLDFRGSDDFEDDVCVVCLDVE